MATRNQEKAALAVSVIIGLNVELIKCLSEGQKKEFDRMIREGELDHFHNQDELIRLTAELAADAFGPVESGVLN